MEKITQKKSHQNISDRISLFLYVFKWFFTESVFILPSSFFPLHFLVLEVNSLHTVADGGQHLVRDGLEDVAQCLDRQMLAEDFYRISFLARDVGHVDHAHIHTDSNK